jgi:hypothetical protein
MWWQLRGTLRTDLGVSLSEAGHEVTVLCGSHGYDNPANELPRKEE